MLVIDVVLNYTSSIINTIHHGCNIIRDGRTRYPCQIASDRFPLPFCVLVSSPVYGGACEGIGTEGCCGGSSNG